MHIGLIGGIGPVIDCAEVHVDALYQRSASHR